MGDDDRRDFVEVVSYAGVADIPGIALIGTAAASTIGLEKWNTLRDVPGTGQHGVAWLGYFKAGHLHRIRVAFVGGARKQFRLELHGAVTRYQRCFCDVDLVAGTVRSAEEMRSAELRRLENGFELVCTFVPQFSTTQWFYLLSRAEEAVNVPACEGAAFSVGPFELSASRERTPGFRVLRHNPAIELAGGVLFALQTYLLLRNYFHLEFEIEANGKVPASINITTGRRIAYAAWVSPTPHLRGDPTRPLLWSADNDGTPATKTMKLIPSPAVQPLPSPALFDRFGPSHSWRGQAIWGLFAEWTDIDLEPAEVSRNSVELCLDVTFSDGSATRVALDSHALQRLTLPAEPTVVDVMWREIAATPTGRFLEVGGRGSNPTINRQRLGERWTYSGFDVLAGPNVDIVGDAHELSRYFEAQTFDVLFADQVLEHLLMPWKFIVEANRVLKPDGLLCLSTPSALPLHAEPWDFYRFSDHSWSGMLNPRTGFKIIDKSVSWPIVMLPRAVVPGHERMQRDPAFMMTAVLARKVSEPAVDWPAYQCELAQGLYPRDR